MPGPLLNALETALRGVIWVVYGPYSGLVPLLLLYGVLEFGLDFFASRSRRERRLDAAMLLNCALGVVVWLMKPHIPLILLALLALGIVATVVALILAIRGKGRRKKRRQPASDRETRGEAGAVEEPSHETELAQS